jgi:hypothetical protein
MLSGSVEPACRRTHSSVLAWTTGAVSGHDAPGPRAAQTSISAYDAPDQQATTAVTRATIHPIANRVTTARRGPFLPTARTRVGTQGAPDWANSIAVN